MAQRQLKLGAFMRPVSIHTGAWRYPGAWPDANFNFPHIKKLIQKLEAGKFDAFFMADHLAVLNMPISALKRSHTVTSFEPFTLLSALAGATEHIGLIATGSTTFDEPYHVARRFASLELRIVEHAHPLHRKHLMSSQRQLRLGAFMRPVSIHTGAWRYPGAFPDANFNFKHIKSFAQKLEAAKFDAFFMADHLAVLNMPIEALKRSHTVTSFEPFTLLSALASVTERIGLVATASSTFDQPYHIARRFASLDHISDGRAGWNIVTTSNPDAALNFGLEDHVEHDERYRRAREFYDVVTGLWDSFADDAFIRNVETGIFFDPEKMHVLDHKGENLSVRGPLNIARTPQRSYWLRSCRRAGTT